MRKKCDGGIVWGEQGLGFNIGKILCSRDDNHPAVEEELLSMILR